MTSTVGGHHLPELLSGNRVHLNVQGCSIVKALCGRARRGLEAAPGRGGGTGGGVGGSKVNPGSPLGQPWVPDFWGATVGPRRKLDYGGSR